MPDTATALRRLIVQVRETLPFDAQELRECSGDCANCRARLLDFLAGELEAWERRLDLGVVPGLADLSRLAQTSREVDSALRRDAQHCNRR